MNLVLDNNILFSLMNPNSINSYLFSSLRANFSAPAFAMTEFEKYISICLSKSKLSEHEFQIRRREIEEQVEFVQLSKYRKFMKLSIVALTDKDDIDFLALALSLKSAIWSNDKHFKQQSLVQVFTTRELVNQLLFGEN